MSISPEALRLDADCMWVDLSRRGIHWPELDEDISVAGLLAGRGDQTRTDHAA
ncbi:MAG: DUF2442 domain-containing protein [Boseongicola sp. SB0673_bin_14]|nr:DUF2442 domain-containing protein [Boseongicola sp. SB0667_bin_21]MYI70050.1 DUF2442 domain-containing protein [Boseongicola sp. SB0673_bin_14]